MASPSISRERSPIAVLTDPMRDIPMGERDIRFEDYLNDKLQSTADFAGLPNLILNVEAQKTQLEEQLKDARAKLEAAKKQSADHTSQILEQTKEFERQQNSVQQRLMIVTSSDTPDEAMQKLTGPMEKLRRVELASYYVELLKEVDDLTKDARQHLPANPKEALKPYTQLKELSMSLRDLQDAAEGAAVHLITHVQNTSDRLWVEMKRIMSDEFESVLQRSKWPDIASEPTREWSDCFEKLLDLQAPEIMGAREPLVLLPMNVLAKSFVLQFRYHFFSDKPTNHPHKLGDYFFEWFLGTVTRWEVFLRENVGPVLAAHFRGNILAGNPLYVDPVSAFITALLPVMKEKVDDLVVKISNEPRLLSRFMKQLLDFDDTIRTRFDYEGGNPELGWKGLSWEVLDTWFDRWIKVEKYFAFARYQEIIRSPDSGKIDYDSAEPGKTKSTYGAAQVTDLLDTVTLQYKRLRRFSHKVRFLIEIQAEIIDQYHGRLGDSLDVYQTMTSTVGRTLHGLTKEQQASVEGVAGLESLCKVFGSTEHIIAVLEEWSNTEFFVDLWDQLQDRAKTTDTADNLAGDMSYKDVKGATSAAVGSDDEGSVWDATINGFQGLRDRAEVLIIQAVKSNLPISFRNYFSKPQWTTVGDEPDLSSLSVTAELDQPLQTLKQQMDFLHKALAYPPFRRIWRAAFDYLQDLLWNDILIRQDFTTLGAARFRQDLLAIQSVVNSVASETGTAFGMPKLKEGVSLLNLSLDIDESHEPALSLREASHNIFAGNAEAEEVLQKLGMTHISRNDARAILQRRVEAND